MYEVFIVFCSVNESLKSFVLQETLKQRKAVLITRTHERVDFCGIIKISLMDIFNKTFS